MNKIKILLACAFLLTGCGNDKIINGVKYGVFGLANQSEMQNPDIAYELSWGSLIVGFIFSETVIVPLYVVLFDLYEPVSSKDYPSIKGQVQ